MDSSRFVRIRPLFEGYRTFFAVAAVAFVLLGLGALTRYAPFQGLDLHVTQEFQERNWPPLKALMLVVTTLGSPVGVVVLGLVVAAALGWKGLPRDARLVLSSLAAVPIGLLLKLVWDRARPDAALVHVEVLTSGSSFPSGHATGSTALCGALAVLAWAHLGRRPARVAAVLALIGLAAAVDVSRVYLGAHWLSDVAGGSAAGLLVLIPLVRGYLGRAAVEPAAP